MAHTLALEADALWRIVLVALLLGAGLPALFAVGIRAGAHGRGGDAEVATAGGGEAPAHPAGRAVALLCYTVVLAVVALGITFIVATGFGQTISFEHVYPTIVPKP